MMKILLASNSARRRELIKLTGWKFITCAPNVNEDRIAAEPARDYVMRLAREKAIAVRQDTRAEYILTADTIVVDHETIHGKPADAEDACRILLQLRNHNHTVMTAIVLYEREVQIQVEDLCVSTVPMRDYTRDEIVAYVASGDPMDKAGAYAIQNNSFHPVTGFSGCYASVMGMPLCHLARIAKKLDLSTAPDLAVKCQSSLNYTCHIHAAVFRGDIIG